MGPVPPDDDAVAVALDVVNSIVKSRRHFVQGAQFVG